MFSSKNCETVTDIEGKGIFTPALRSRVANVKGLTA